MRKQAWTLLPTKNFYGFDFIFSEISDWTSFYEGGIMDKLIGIVLEVHFESVLKVVGLIAALV